MSRAKQLSVAVGLAAAAFAGSAIAVPTATAVIPSSISFQQYSGTGTIGGGGIDSSTLYWVKEKTFGAIESFLVFFDPARTTLVAALLDFGKPIQAVFTSTQDLRGSSAFQNASLDYRYRGGTGLEGSDVVSFAPGSSRLELVWQANGAGDAIRVLTAVPEPSTYAMFGVGLVLVGMIARRRMSGKA